MSFFGAARVTQALGTPIVLESALTLEITATLTNGFAVSLNSGSSPFLTVPAARYGLPEFSKTVVDQLKQWFKNAADAAANIDIASAADVDLTLAFAPVIGVNTSFFSLTLAPTNFNVKGTPATSVTAFVIPSTHTGWSAILGLSGEGQAATGTVTGSNRIIQGAFQPRSFFAFPGSYRAPGQRRKRSDRSAHITASGKVHQYVAGTTWYEFPFQLVNLPAYYAAPPKVAGRCKSYSLVSSVPTLKTSNPSLTGTSGFSSVYIASDLLEVGTFAQCGSWYSRVVSKTLPAAPTDNSIVWLEAPPSSNEEAPEAGKPIKRISEAMALIQEVERTGQLLFYEINDDGGAQRWLTSCYSLPSDGEAVDAPERHSDELDVYSLNFGDLIEDRLPQLVTI
jgi:hypothetical protein